MKNIDLINHEEAKNAKEEGRRKKVGNLTLRRDYY
jgi:hypothetical protein